jgi:hypothetical protein
MHKVTRLAHNNVDFHFVWTFTLHTTLAEYRGKQVSGRSLVSPRYRLLHHKLTQGAVPATLTGY